MATPLLDDVWRNRHVMIDDLLHELRERARAAGDTQDVRLIETHVSWVLLGPEVYKIKKPVSLPYVDFSTFGKREAACRAEVEINQRLAPRTYLGVVPIRRMSHGAHTFGAAGAVVDWAVHMVRLDDAGRADLLLGRGELSASHVDRVAVGLASFHADAATGADISACADFSAIEQNVIDNFRMLDSSAVGLVTAEQAWELQRWQLAFLRGHRSLFAARIASGAIRDGHGDLRLEHVFFRPDGDFEVIDGVEFDPRYRWADVCADVAFFAMDLARLGRVDLAERFLATYARAANDFDIYPLVDFYEGYRACVRAKIAAAVARDPSSSDEVQATAKADARRYLLLALTRGRRSLLGPTLVVVAGGIASGKSALAELLGDRLGAPVIDADRTRKHLLGLEPTAHADDSAWSGAYDPTFSEHVYGEVLRRVDAVLSSGRPVVVDASFRTMAARAAARDLAGRHNVPFRLFECVAPLDVCRARVRQRDRATSVSDGRAEILDAFAARFEPIVELPPTEHRRIDTGGSVEQALAQVERELGTWPARLVS
jgi:aminoglycoside phosphotransferase family enzyme/predicted kinase